jgi:ATP-dependent DNA helicase RecQ
VTRLAEALRFGPLARTAAPDRAGRRYPVHSRVTHAEWGGGTVLRYEGAQMTVLFDELGYKTLSIPVVEEQGLLR